MTKMLFSKVLLCFAFIRFTFSLPPTKPASYLLPPPPSSYFREANSQSAHALNQESIHLQLREQNSNLLQNIRKSSQRYLETTVNDKLEPPKPMLIPFNAANTYVGTMRQQNVPPVQREIQHSQILNRNVHSHLFNSNRPLFAAQPPLNRIVSPLPIHQAHNTGHQTMAKKAFTIIYPNGTTEQSDSLEDIIKIYPNYVLLKSSDVNRNSLPTRVNYLGPIESERAYAKNALAKPILVPLFNKDSLKVLPMNYTRETMFSNTLKDNSYRSPQIVTNNILSKIITTDANNMLPLESKDIMKTELNKKAVEENFRVDEKAQQNKNKIQDIDSYVSALYSQNNISTAITNKTVSQSIETEFNISTRDDKFPVLVTNTLISKPVTSNNVVLDSNTVESKFNTVENGSKVDVVSKRAENNIQDNLTVSSTPILYSQNNSTVVTNKTVSKTNINAPNVSTLESDERETPDMESEEDLTTENNLYIPEIELPIDNPYNDEDILETNLDEDDNDFNVKNDADKASESSLNCINEENCSEKIYVPNIALVPENDSESPFWFDAFDEDVWDKLLKNYTNTIFFFVPKTSFEKDTTITIYPNGTKIEEIKITKKDGSKPVVTTIITHGNDKEINNS